MFPSHALGPLGVSMLCASLCAGAPAGSDHCSDWCASHAESWDTKCKQTAWVAGKWCTACAECQDRVHLCEPMQNGPGGMVEATLGHFNASKSLVFLRPAKTGSNSLIEAFNAARAADPFGCAQASMANHHYFDVDVSRRQFTGACSLRTAAVLREPCERFVSAFHYSQKWASWDWQNCSRDPGCMRARIQQLLMQKQNPWYLTEIQRAQPMLLPLAKSPTPFDWASRLLSDLKLRRAWLSAPGMSCNVNGSNFLAGEMCGFVPQANYVDAKHPLVACLPRMTEGVQKLLDERAGLQAAK